ncbi:MAG: calcium/sodium antiporter [Gemmatimonadetes bacterium]|nr:calcium/sodium antiporter [Gemmatimonadota bacterium]MYI06942.1 calcium/sodium antiporter [Gemmatimonadota bacterium]
MTVVAHVLYLVGGFGALYFGAEWLVRGAARIASTMGISPVVVGLTLVALGTSAPELVVAIYSTLEGDGGLLMGNVLGSNLANIGLILGATALVSPLGVADRVVTRDIPIMLLITVFVFPLILDGSVDWGDGVILLVLLVVYVVFTFGTAEEEIRDIQEEVGSLTEKPEEVARDMLRSLGLAAAGAIGLAGGGWAIVEGATFIAEQFGLGTDKIGLTVVAVGTSLPELVTSVVAAVRRQPDLAVGNVVGSNIFNLTAVMGAAALVEGYPVGESILAYQLPAVLALSLLVWPVAASARRVRRTEGFLLLVGCLGFMTWITLAN